MPTNFKTKSGKAIKFVLLSENDTLRFYKSSSGISGLESPQTLSKFPILTEALRPAGPAREIPLSTGKSHIAIAPNDADFTNAAVWKIQLPAGLNAEQRLSANENMDTNSPGRRPAIQGNPLLRIRYVGDVARLTLNGKLIADNFYSGREFDLGLKRYAPEIFTGDLRLEILPLRKDAPIFLEPRARPDFGTNASLVKLQAADIVN